MVQSTRPSMRLSRPLAIYLTALTWSLLGYHALCQAGSHSQTLAEMYHKSWTVREGAPGNINAIAQTRDRYIWLGTDDGLFRFDGISFERYQPSGDPLPAMNIWTLQVMPDGGLWIGYRYSGASYLKDGRNMNYGPNDGLIYGAMWGFAKDSEGDVWAVSSNGLLRLEGHRWQRIGSSWNYPSANATSVFLDKRGTLWVGSGTLLLSLQRGEKQFRKVADPVNKIFFRSYPLSEAPDGSLWMAIQKPSSIRAVLSPAGSPRSYSKKLPFRLETIHFGHDGSLWMSTLDDGIFRLPAGGVAEATSEHATIPMQHFSRKDGLTSNSTRAFLEDPEGSTWVATPEGIDQFRSAALTPVQLPAAYDRMALLTGRDDDLLITSATTLDLLVGQPPAFKLIHEIRGPLHGEEPGLTCAYRDPHGIIWLGGYDGLWHGSGMSFAPQNLPPGLDPLIHSVQAITMDKDDVLWVSFNSSGVYRLSHGIWSRATVLSLSPDRPVLVEHTDTGGRVWFGYGADLIEILEHGRVTAFGPQSGLDIGNVTAISEHGGSFWVGGETGLQFYREGRFQRVELAQNGSLASITGIVQTSSGDLWINQASGVVHIDGDQVRLAQNNPTFRVQTTLYNYLDGLAGSLRQTRPLPTALQSDSGRIYFLTRTGMVWIDPAHLLRNTVLPPVSITSVTADGLQHVGGTKLVLPVNTRNIEISFTALSMLIPQRVHFRYKMDGIDSEWQEVGTRRQAFYSRLPPGSYSFHVLASNNDGLWNETGANIELSFPPSFLQSIWFKFICFSAAVALLGLLYHLRIRHLTNVVRTRLYDRLAERERIARDLHDTFFQGIQGLLLRFNTLTSQLQTNEPARANFEEVLKQSDDVMLEGRELVLDLRTVATNDSSLSEAFSEAGAELRKGGNANFKVLVIGEPRPLHSIVFEELYRIGREALGNAFRHSHAGTIEAELNYRNDGLRLLFRDDGDGIEASILSDGRRDKHWGLPGMRERAAKIGAHLEIWSRKGAGTEIEVRIPNSLAYRSALTGWRSHFFRRLLPGKEESYE
jgi:signal transduction histidine kinase/ligand-binding sensor domain-containing protein